MALLGLLLLINLLRVIALIFFFEKISSGNVSWRAGNDERNDVVETMDSILKSLAEYFAADDDGGGGGGRHGPPETPRRRRRRRRRMGGASRRRRRPGRRYLGTGRRRVAGHRKLVVVVIRRRPIGPFVLRVCVLRRCHSVESSSTNFSNRISLAATAS